MASAALIKKGMSVNVESGAGVGAQFLDSAYEDVGAKIVDREAAFQSGKDNSYERDFTTTVFFQFKCNILFTQKQAYYLYINSIFLIFSTFPDIIAKVRAPSTEEIPLLKNKSTLISFVYPAQNPELLSALQEKELTVFGMDTVPRISRAQVCLECALILEIRLTLKQVYSWVNLY